MDSSFVPTAQLVLEFEDATRLLNAAVCRMWRRFGGSKRRTVPDSRAKARERCPTTVELGTAALLDQCRNLLRDDPIEVYPGGYWRAESIWLFNAFKFAFDEDSCRIEVCPRDFIQRFLSDCQSGMERTETMSAYGRIDIFRPLATPFWLQFVAHLPNGICAGSTIDDAFQLPLWPEYPNALQALDRICSNAYEVLRHDADFKRLQAVLSYRLIERIGAPVFSLVLRARANPHVDTPDTAGVCRVWKYLPLYERMGRENPHLLPLLDVWLQERQPLRMRGWTDAVPVIRGELLDIGLAPRAWRYLCAQGVHRLARGDNQYVNWRRIVGWLLALGHARWPDLPPPGFLGLLNDTAGPPTSYTEGSKAVPGWFWNWACAEANASCADPQAYRCLQDEIVRLAWLVRRYQPRPDSNQRRRGLDWLVAWADKKEAETRLSSTDTWNLWLRSLPWEGIDRVRVVPLLSPRSLREEGIALHNCADRYEDVCRAEDCILLSLRDPASGKRIALMGLDRNRGGGIWQLTSLRGPCNRGVAPWVSKLANRVATMVRRGDEAEQAMRVLLRLAAGDSTSKSR